MFQSNVKKYIDIQKIEYLIKSFKNSNEDPAYEDFLLWAEEVIFAILYNSNNWEDLSAYFFELDPYFLMANFILCLLFISINN